MKVLATVTSSGAANNVAIRDCQEAVLADMFRHQVEPVLTSPVAP